MPNVSATNLFDKRKQNTYLAGNMVEDDGFVTTVASPALNDRLKICRIPAGTRVTEITIGNTDIDSGTTVLAGLGWEYEDGSSSNYTAFAAATQTWLQTASERTLNFIGDQAVVLDRDAFLVLSLAGTFAGYAAGGTIRGRVRGQAQGSK